jgi:uncharacterized protein
MLPGVALAARRAGGRGAGGAGAAAAFAAVVSGGAGGGGGSVATGGGTVLVVEVVLVLVDVDVVVALVSAAAVSALRPFDPQAVVSAASRRSPVARDRGVNARYLRLGARSIAAPTSTSATSTPTLTRFTDTIDGGEVEVRRRDVEFGAADGTTLRGWLYEPEGVRSGGPAVVMTHGFSATIDMALDGYASVFCDAGLTVLVHDHRHLGRSDGEPRQLINPWRQARDQIAALDWLCTQPGIDGTRLGVWGSSFSGGQAIVLGAVDQRVRAVVANVPFVGGFADDRPVDVRYEELRSALLDDGADAPANATEAPAGPIAVVKEGDTDARAFLPQAEAARWFLDAGRREGAGWENHVLLQRAFGTSPAFDPAVCVPYLHAAALFVVATEDDVAPTATALRVFEEAREPKDRVMIEGHHFTPYSGDALDRAATAARDWFVRWLHGGN